jgi:multidrug resistance efflux pump
MNNKKIDQKTIILIAVIFGLIGLLAAAIFFYNSERRIYADKAEITAATVDLSSQAGGVLEELMVKEGDKVTANEVVARVGNELIKTDTAGLIIAVKNSLGKNFSRGETIVSLLNPNDLRVVAHLDEDKGLKDIAVGQRVIFTADAYGSRPYVGMVDEISEVSRSSAVVFNISDKREVKQFDIKIRFNFNDYPELKNGMSAKVWIYKK